MLKKLLCLALACICVLTFAACNGSKKPNKNSSDKNSSSTPLDSGSRVTSGGVSMGDVDEELLESDLSKKDYGGKEFKLYYYYQYGEEIDRKIDAFNKKHNANITTEIGTSFSEDIAKSIADGTPYDIISSHSDYFPQSVMSNLFEPLDSVLGDERDYFNPANPRNGGFSRNVIDAFTWDGKKYTVGSAQSIYSMVFYYNKKLFADAGLEDPYDLWKSGKWTWDKCVEMSDQVSDPDSTTVFLEEIALSNWLTLNGCKYVKVNGMTATENLNDPKVLAAIQKWQDLFLSENPMCCTTYCSLFGSNAVAYASISYTDTYAYHVDRALNASIFEKNSANLGVVPMPTGLIDEGVYAGHVPQGYAAARGAKDISVAACYALFESRVVMEDLNVETQMPSEIMNAVNDAFATNGFLGFSGWKDSSGVSPNTYLKEIQTELKEGADVASTVAAKRPEVTKCLEATMALIK